MASFLDLARFYILYKNWPLKNSEQRACENALDSLTEMKESLISDATITYDFTIKQFKDFALFNPETAKKITKTIGKKVYDREWKISHKLFNLICHPLTFLSFSFYSNLGDKTINQNAEYAKEALSLFIDERMISLRDRIAVLNYR